jgi:tetraacyldisaccharide 4'-kinase
MLTYIYNLATDRYKGPVAGIVKSFLYLLSLIYGLIVRILIFIYRLKPYRLNCKVISVGNITLGGTGKTSLVEFIARYLKQQGHKVAILTRGYKRKITNYGLRITDYEMMGDEPHMLKMNLEDIPVIVDADRVRAAKLAMRDYGVDTIILDDGFQQWRIKKDLEIVTIDATCPFGNRKLIPRGILREPLSSLKRPDVFVLTKTNLGASLLQEIKDFLGKINPEVLVIESIHSPLGFYKMGTNEILGTGVLQGKTVTLFSGIGAPDSFENLIKSLGIQVGLSFRFRDHHNYTQRDLENIFKSARDKNIDIIITTEKDAARLNQLPDPRYGVGTPSCQLPVIFLRIELRITKDEERFYHRLLRLYFY